MGVVIALCACGSGGSASSDARTDSVSRDTLDPAGLLFKSSWDTALGNSLLALNDGDIWQRNVCHGTPSPNMLDVFEVVVGDAYGWHATDSILRLKQRGSSACGVVEVLDRIPASTSFYFRYYIWIQEGSGRAHHHNTLNCCGAIQAVHWTKLMLGTSHLGTPGVQPYFAFGATEYPYDRWAPKDGQYWAYEHWYRLEGHVEFTSSDEARWHYRVYHHGTTVSAGDEGTLLQTDADFYGGGGEPNRTENETMRAWFQQGNRHRFTNLQLARQFGLGTEGGGFNSDTCPDGVTGCRSWAYAAVEVRSDTWPGPI